MPILPLEEEDIIPEKDNTVAGILKKVARELIKGRALFNKLDVSKHQSTGISKSKPIFYERRSVDPHDPPAGGPMPSGTPFAPAFYDDPLDRKEDPLAVGVLDIFRQRLIEVGFTAATHKTPANVKTDWNVVIMNLGEDLRLAFSAEFVLATFKMNDTIFAQSVEKLIEQRIESRKETRNGIPIIDDYAGTIHPKLRDKSAVDWGKLGSDLADMGYPPPSEDDYEEWTSEKEEGE